MSVEIITKEDLQYFRLQLLNDLRECISQLKPPAHDSLEGLKTGHVRKMLHCSNGKLQALRIAGKLRCKKVGGTLYYRKEDVKKLLEEDS
jgi:hypothetical protein